MSAHSRDGKDALRNLSFPAFRIAAIFPVLQSPPRIKGRQGGCKGMIGMMRVLKSILAIGLLAILLSPAASRADEFKLSNNQRISCGRGLSAGKLNTATCRSYAYLFDIKTSEYYRCTVSLALTRNNNIEVVGRDNIVVNADGAQLWPRPRKPKAKAALAFDAALDHDIAVKKPVRLKPRPPRP